MIRVRTLTGRQVGQVIVARHHLADSLEHTGEFLNALYDHVHRTEVRPVESGDKREQPFELSRRPVYSAVVFDR